MKTGGQGTVTVFALAVLLVAGFPESLPADGKKLEVTADQAAIHIDPQTASAVVEVLERDSILTLASPMKIKIYWFYVYFISPQTGKTRAGYVHDSLVRPLYPLVKVINISGGTGGASNGEIDPEAGNLINPSWGVTKESIIRTEGRPYEEEQADGVRILRYRRSAMNRKWQVEYVLGETGLITTRYRLLENYFDSSRYIQDYNKLRIFLTQKVGEPRSDKVVWRKKVYEKVEEDPGTALANGYMVYLSEWVFRDTSVKLKLDGAGEQVSLAAEVRDVKARIPGD